MSTTTLSQPTIQPDRDPDEIEIRVSDIIQFVKDSRRAMFLWGAALAIVGAIYAFTQPNEYTSTVRVMPELKSGSGGGGLGDLKSLAGLAGVSLDGLGGSSEAIRPDLYPDIMQSTSFMLHLLAQPVTTAENKKPQTLQQYLLSQGANTVMGRLGSLLGSDDEPQPVPDDAAVRLTKKQEELTKKVAQRVGAVMDKKSGIVTITAQMTDPVVAATMAKQSLDYLTNYVTNYRTGKARKQANFLSQQVSNARRRYESAELALSAYRDRNRALFLNTAKIEEQRLQADYMLAQTVYNDLSKQLEQARIKVQEESPVFQVLEPARVPLRKSGPKRTMIVLGFGILGAILGMAIFGFKRFFSSAK
ncbi:GNVR domain-containing protein [Spirosoma montaniterrae]|uniref:Lipopolysaccharide biosynthesis protein n=1 Tax=Spirosoma montaniterrae TaxID=1178516 RepID=A0A1P9X260_9BACT|nr:GNVR domain-containing protein [Spirosoma montaniterrae]AQG81683.1 lipopolysaccharide biosynthesis protein [Spirosoma montaniterrae]